MRCGRAGFVETETCMSLLRTPRRLKLLPAVAKLHGRLAHLSGSRCAPPMTSTARTAQRAAAPGPQGEQGMWHSRRQCFNLARHVTAWELALAA